MAIRPLLTQAGLTVGQLADTRARLPVNNQIRFLNLVAAALDNDTLGLDLALDFELRRAGMLYYVLASSHTLGDAFERGARFASIVNEGVVQEFLHGRRVGIVMYYAGIRRRDDRHQIEFWMAALVRIFRNLTAQNLKPARVGLTHYRGKGGARFSRFLGCEVEFGAARDEILFEHETARLRINNADPFLNRVLVDACEESLARQRGAPQSFAARVENAIAPQLPHGKGSAAHMAAEFGMSERTFARRLADEGETFSRLLDRLRLELARRYLVGEKLPISKVAWLLGYREPGAFSHAFRRWTGKSPSEFARQAR